MIIALKQTTKTPKHRDKTMNAFLPEDYEAPTNAGNYMKFQTGENKIRILSAPLLGWEDWTEDKKPVRFCYDTKPVKPINSARPIKHFWAMIVWNYREEKIQILQISQASIRNAIQSLYQNEDWGAPYFYDIKITKKGEKVDTEYNVAPSPHKPIGDHIRKAFEDRPCDLEALIDGSDPFAPSARKTPGIFDKMDAEVSLEAALNAKQQEEIMAMVGEDDEIIKRILNGYKVKSIDLIPARHFETIKNHLSRRKGGQ